MATSVDLNAADQTETTNKLLNVADVTKSFMNAMKFRRMTVGPDVEMKESDIETTRKRKFPSVSGISDTASDKNGSVRRKSTLRGISQTITQMLRIRRFTLSDKSKVSNKPKVRYENTYKMEPEPGKHFDISKIEHVVYAEMEERLKNQTYDQATAGREACQLSNQLKNRVKELNLPRFRVICQTVIAENADQGMAASSRYLWDEKKDNYVCVTYSNASLIAVAIVHGVYFE